jgi:hypothetical protein
MDRLYSLFCCCFVALSLPLAAMHFNYTANARDAYQEVLSLRFEKARILLQQIKECDHNNLVVHHIENYIDFLTVYINEDEAEYNRLKKRCDLRLEAVRQGDANSPYFLYVQADILLQWALARLKFGEYLNAFLDVNRAHKLLRENREKFPQFMPTYKNLGVLHAMVGTIPDGYKWGVKLLSGLNGSIDQGKRELEMVLRHGRQNDFLFLEETEALYAFVLLHLERDEEAAWKVVREAGWDPHTNLLQCFVQANIAMRTGRNDEAIRILQRRPQGAGYLAFPYLEFMLGVAKLRRLDSDADVHLAYYVQHFRGRNFLKEAYQKLAWHQLIHGNSEGYRRYMEACRNRGGTVVGGDISAQREAEAEDLPDRSLLKARLLFDGGYYRKAYDALASKAEPDFIAKRFRLEYLYRMGRILHGMKQYPQALHYYQLTIDRGVYESYYFACNAALQAGLIYEKLGLENRAVEFFNRCLSMHPAEYRTGLHQMAKSGLNRILRVE